MNLPENQPCLQIRLATADEAASIAFVLYQSFIEYEPLYTPEAFAATTPSADQIQKRWSEGPVWVAVQPDGLVGTVAAAPKGEALYVRSMAILPTARGQRIGRLLRAQVSAAGAPCSAVEIWSRQPGIAVVIHDQLQQTARMLGKSCAPLL